MPKASQSQPPEKALQRDQSKEKKVVALIQKKGGLTASKKRGHVVEAHTKEDLAFYGL